jgi:hypothetical protein
MSLLAATTDKKALAILAGMLPLFGQLDRLPMGAADAYAAREAENLIRGIIDTNTILES